MIVTIINVHVKPSDIDAFRSVTYENASNSINEPGIIRFDVYQQSDDPSRFILAEIYKSEQDVEKHHLTAHYAHWRVSVSNMMAEPRQRNTYNFVFPAEQEP
jgi:autoinducer 2-degrading protein